MDFYNEDYLQHYGVLGMKWGIRRTPQQLGRKSHMKEKELTSKVSRAHKLANDAERYQGRANAALQASKGQKILATKAKNAGDESGAKKHERNSSKLLSEYEKYETLSEKAVSDFLKTKASALYDSAKVSNGAKYVDSLAGLNIKQDNMDRYEMLYKSNRRYAEGYDAERQNLQSIYAKHK